MKTHACTLQHKYLKMVNVPYSFRQTKHCEVMVFFFSFNFFLFSETAVCLYLTFTGTHAHHLEWMKRQTLKEKWIDYYLTQQIY